MIQELLQSIEGIEIYPVISLVLFVSVFFYMTYKVIRMDGSHIDRMSRLPLESGDGPKDGDHDHV